MLRRLIMIALLVVVAGFATSFLIRQEGVTVVEWLGYRIEVRTSLLAVAGLVLIIAVVMLDRMIGFLAGLPIRLSQGLKQRRHDAGHQALALGLVAASVGDRREAGRQEKKARRLIGDGMLTSLLTAQVATLDGKTDVASKYFTELAESLDTAYFGQAGLMRLQLESGDDEAALAAGRAAFARKKNEPTLARALFTLEARRGNWPEAITALAVARRASSDEKERQTADMAMAVLHYSHALDLDAGGQHTAALKSLEKGLSYAAGLVPAAVMAARFYQEQNRNRKALSALEKAFIETPHPDLGEALMEVLSGDTNKRLTRIMHLADKGGNTPEALVIAAGYATQLELWGEALRLIGMIDEADRDAAAWTLLAEIARHAPAPKNSDKNKVSSTETEDAASKKVMPWPDAETCLTRAATARRAPTWHCRSCGVTATEWQATCSGCGSFASMTWRRAG